MNRSINRQTWVFLCLTVILTVRLGNAAPAEQQKLSAANSDFTFRLLKELTKEQPAKNVFVSSYSVEACLQMVCNGASGPTKTEILQTLGLAGVQQNSINTGASEIRASLDSMGTNVILNTANAIWCRKDVPVNPAFLSCNQQFFHATVQNIDFDDPHSVDAINGWVANATRNRISKIIDGPLDPATDLFLANAVYFKSKWEEPFDAKATTNRDFHLRAGSPQKVPMMEQNRHFDYRQGTGYQAVHLRYEGYSLGMYVFLPDENSTPEKLLDILNGDKWRRVTKPGFHDQEGTLIWPKFKIEYDVELKPTLKALGIKAAFGAADFSGISNRKLFISAVRQKAFVEVTEEGTEAAAVTGMMVNAMGIEMNPPKPFRMSVDRPFVILIEDERTGMVLFSGVIFDPSL